MIVLEDSGTRARSGRRKRLTIAVAVVVVIGALAVGGALGLHWWQHGPARGPMSEYQVSSFPAMDRSTLTDEQARVVDVLRAQYAEQSGRDKYSEGVDEPWCADFVSWVMREAGRPLRNPNSGSWRIPGVYTLEDYFRGEHRFEAADSGYRPHVGDVVMYSSSSRFGQHTNIVVAADTDTMTTVGGNESGEPGRVVIHTFRLDQISGLVGFGRLETP